MNTWESGGRVLRILNHGIEWGGCALNFALRFLQGKDPGIDCKGYTVTPDVLIIPISGTEPLVSSPYLVTGCYLHNGCCIYINF
jgi:hypothetical protein